MPVMFDFADKKASTLQLSTTYLLVVNFISHCNVRFYPFFSISKENYNEAILLTNKYSKKVLLLLKKPYTLQPTRQKLL